MAAITITRATLTNLGSWPIGCDSDWIIDMGEDTTGWNVTHDFALKLGGTPFLSYTTEGGTITVGGGPNKFFITIGVLGSDQTGANWTGIDLYWVTHRTDAGQHDRLAFGTIKPDKPGV